MTYLVNCGAFNVRQPDLRAAISYGKTYCSTATITGGKVEKGAWVGKYRPVAHIEDGQVTARPGWAWPNDAEEREVAAWAKKVKS